ncbi:hypothetical protein POJ06DRAFT_277923 [Lipomyces tetrasporus]|uniref:Uncharacterized protein n=1 Tax=Lipomyces tetrasporus TaxID=54092 RepID=A0AAD7VQS1_9ASCO|nr:uncharacterized protein POJ06DRAFT_277923 [Lipomyces tetrasporus]KAJ8097884.1 hypothetical protein POJ06DRAFT_277923 [Lipomyces tetrasporus]
MLASSHPVEGNFLLRRATSIASASSTSTSSASVAERSCSSNDKSSFCEKPVGSQALPIALGVAIPLSLAIIVLFFLHRRHVRRLKKEDLVAAQIDLTQDDFDLAPPGTRLKGGREKNYGSDYLLPMTDDFSQSRISLNSPYDVVAQEVSRLVVHGNHSYPALPRAPESAKLRNSSFYQRDSPYDFRNQFKGDNASIKAPSTLSTMTASTIDVHSTRNMPKLPVKRTKQPSTVEECFELQEVSKPQSVLASASSSDDSFSDPIVSGVYNGFHELAQDDPSASDLSSSPPGKSLSPPESIHSAPPSPFPTRSDSVHRHSQRHRSTAPPVPIRVSKLPPEDRVSYYSDPSDSDSDESDGVEKHQEAPEPPAHQVSVTSTEAIAPTEAETANHAVPQDSTLQRDNALLRQRSFSSPADAEERVNRQRSFYRVYFDGAMPDRHGPALPTQIQDDSAVAYDSTGRVPASRMGPRSGINSSPHSSAARALNPMPRRRMELNGKFLTEVPSSMSSQSDRPSEDWVQHRSGRQPYPASSNGYYTPPYQPQHQQYMQLPQPMSQRMQPRQLPPLQPLSPLPTPYQLGEEKILGSPTSFAPPRRPRPGPSGSSVGSPGGSPTNPQQPWTGVQLRSLPTPYLLRNSASYSGLEFLPPKKYAPSGIVAPSYDADNMYQYGYGQHTVGNRLSQRLPQELVPVGREGVEDNLRPQWSMRE